jgi:Protein of unknown function (DUF2934)
VVAWVLSSGEKSLLWFVAGGRASAGLLPPLKIRRRIKRDFRRFLMSTETVKRTKAPAKAKTAVKTQTGQTESAVKTAPAVAAKTKLKAAPKTKAVDVAASHTPTYEEIAQLAERYWAERGWQDGYAEQDWLRAEQELLGMAS